MARRGSVLFVAAFTVLACGGEDRPPLPPRFDAGRRDTGSGADAAPPDDAPRDAGRGDGGPRLPPADLEIELPYFGPEQTLTLTATIAPGRLDVHVSVDTTGSFGEEIDAIQRDLDRRVIPGIRERVEDVAFGISRFEDFPSEPWGGPDDLPFELLTPVTTDVGRVQRAVAGLEPLGHGGDAPESGAEALWQIATGEGYVSPAGRRLVPAFDAERAEAAGSIGGIGLREGALHVVVHVTDAPTHGPPDYLPDFPGTHDVSEAVAALSAIDARTIGIASGEVARGHLETIALATGAVIPPRDGSCPTGPGGSPREPVSARCPLVFDIAADGTGLADTIVDAIAELVASVRYAEVYGAARDDRLGFVRTFEAVRADPPEGQPAPARADRRPEGDGIDDTFLDVTAGTEVEMRLHLRNVTVRPAPDYDQVFRIAVELRGDDLVLTTRTLRVLVRRGRLDAGAPDAAGAADAAGAG